MNYKKISQDLLKRDYIDERMIMCHSNSTVASSKNMILFTKVTTIRQDNLPYFMILSINKDKLHICFANMFGGFKKYYGYIELSRISYIDKSVINSVTDSYRFNVLTDEGKMFDFYINASQKKKEAQALIMAIIDYKGK